MAKFYGSAVKTGKLGGSVFAIRNGVVIERQYQPIVANPSTILQVQSRAKLKMLSQMSAILAPVIAFRRVRNVSPRNIFVKANYQAATYVDSQASLPMTDLDITGGILAMTSVTASRANRALGFTLDAARTDLSRVVYAALLKSGDEYVLIGSAVVDTPGDDHLFAYQSNWDTPSNTPIVTIAYGIRDNNDAARAAFGNVMASTDSTLAVLDVVRRLSETDVTLTETFASVAIPGSGA